MKRIHLLAVSGSAEGYEELLRGASEAGLRIGWLELRAPAGVPPSLEAATGAGAARAAAVGEGRAVTLKRLRGEPVLRDLLREHFLGCQAVLVHGSGGLPVLAREGEGWSVESPDGARHRFDLGQLLAALRKPRPAWLEGKPD